MEYTTTGGEVIRIAEVCGFCSLSTGGAHELGCPMGQQLAWFDPITGITVFYAPRVTFQDSREKE